MTELIEASKIGDTAKVKLLLDKGAPLDDKDEYRGITSLHWAIKNGHNEVVQLLLDKGASLDVQDRKGETALHLASRDGKTEVVQLLLDKGASVVVQGEFGSPALHLAIANGHKEVVQLLLDKGAPLDVQGEFGSTALHLAIANGHKEVVQLLLDKGAPLDIQDWEGRTALYKAGMGGRNKEAVQLLLDKGASLDIQAKNGETALHRASWAGLKEMVQQLLDKGASTDVQDVNGRTALHLAILESEKEVMQLLLKAMLLNPDGAFQLDAANRKKHSDELLEALTECDPDEFARIVAIQQICANNTPESDSGTGALRLVELGANAQVQSRDLRSNDPHAADNHQDLFERIQLATAACIQGDEGNRDFFTESYRLSDLFSSPDGRKALERAVQIGAKELLAQPVVQRFVSLVWSGGGIGDTWFEWLIHSVVLLLEILFVLPAVVLVPSLDRWMGKDTEENLWGERSAYFLRLPVIKFVLESAADLALALTLTLAPAADLVTTPTAPLLLYWIGSALLWECRQIATSESTSSSRLGRVRDRVAAYAGDRLNLVDATALSVSFASMVAVVSADDPDDAIATSLRAVGVFLLWCRLLRVLLVSPKLGPFVLMFFRMLFGDVQYYLVLLLVLLVAFAAAWTVLLQPSQPLLTQQFGDDRRWRWTRSAVAHLEASSCYDELGGVDIFTTLQRLIEGALTGGDFFECARETTQAPLTAWFISLVYVILTGVLLLNMLIAMMAKTFDNISEAAMTNYLFLFTQRTLALRKEPPTPGLFYALGLPSEAVVGLVELWRTWKKKRKAVDAAPSPPPSPPPPDSEAADTISSAPAPALVTSEPASMAAAETAPAKVGGMPATPLRSAEASQKTIALAEKIRDYILDHQDDVAKEERWRTTLKRDMAKSFRAVDSQLASSSRATDSQLQLILTELREQRKEIDGLRAGLAQGESSANPLSA